MGDRILAEVEVFGPQSCPVAPYADNEWTVSSVSRSACSVDGETAVEEFTLAGDDDATPPQPNEAGIQKVFSYERKHVYEIVRSIGEGCVCERIQRQGCAIHDITATSESLLATFFVDDVETLREIVQSLESTGDTVTLRRLVESAENGDAASPTVFDRDTLTDRQQEVLSRAYEMGYFEHPRDATAGEVAADLDIATTTFTEHLAAAQRKVLDDLLEL